MTAEKHGQEPAVGAAVAGNSNSAGAQLREAREAAGVSIMQAADKLKLDQRTVAALESDDDAKLPAAIFVRGYLRGYARLFGMSGDTLVAAYDARRGDTPEPVASSGYVEGITSDRPSRGGWIISGVLILVILLGTWWYVSGQSLPVALNDLTSSSAVAASTDDSAGEQQSLAVQTAELEESSYEQVDVASAQSQPVAPGVDAASDQLAFNNAADAEPQADVASNGVRTSTSDISGLGSTGLQLERSRPSQVPDQASGIASADVAAATSAAIVAESDDAPEVVAGDQAVLGTAFADVKLLLTTSDDSWVSITDGGGKTLLRGTIPAGGRRELDGVEPIVVFLGNAPAVQVKYKGSLVNHEAYLRRNRTARFSLGNTN